GETVEMIVELAIERSQLRLGVGCGRPVHVHFHAVLHLEAEVLMFELVKAAGEHGRASNEDDRQSSLDDQERFASERRKIGRASCRERVWRKGAGGGVREREE